MIIVISLINKSWNWIKAWFLSNPVSGVSAHEKIVHTFNTLFTKIDGKNLIINVWNCTRVCANPSNWKFIYRNKCYVVQWLVRKYGSCDTLSNCKFIYLNNYYVGKWFVRKYSRILSFSKLSNVFYMVKFYGYKNLHEETML